LRRFRLPRISGLLDKIHSERYHLVATFKGLSHLLLAICFRKQAFVLARSAFRAIVSLGFDEVSRGENTNGLNALLAFRLLTHRVVLAVLAVFLDQNIAVTNSFLERGAGLIFNGDVAVLCQNRAATVVVFLVGSCSFGGCLSRLLAAALSAASVIHRHSQ